MKPWSSQFSYGFSRDNSVFVNVSKIGKQNKEYRRSEITDEGSQTCQHGHTLILYGVNRDKSVQEMIGAKDVVNGWQR